MTQIDNNHSNIKKNERMHADELIKKTQIELLLETLKISKETLLSEKIKSESEILKISNRLNEDIEKTRKFCLEKNIFSCLSIIDNVEYASDLLKNKKTEKVYNLILTKINFIIKIFQEIFNQYKVQKIDQIQTLFNPEIHQAMSVDYNNNMPDNQVIRVMQSGYIFHESRLLRPAMVVVSKKK